MTRLFYTLKLEEDSSERWILRMCKFWKGWWGTQEASAEAQPLQRHKGMMIWVVVLLNTFIQVFLPVCREVKQGRCHELCVCFLRQGLII
jgi:hypothetical protein